MKSWTGDADVGRLESGYGLELYGPGLTLVDLRRRTDNVVSNPAGVEGLEKCETDLDLDWSVDSKSGGYKREGEVMG